MDDLKIPKCLKEDEIANFVEKVNQTADKILGESKLQPKPRVKPKHLAKL